MMLLGGGEGVSNKDEAITACACSRARLVSLGTEMSTGSGNTKITAANIVDPCSWQHFMSHACHPAWFPWPQSIGADSWDTPAFPDECCVIAWPCAVHILPSQHAIPLSCHAVVHNGVQSSTAASRHTQALIFPGAIGMTRERFIVGAGRIPQLRAVLKVRLGPCCKKQGAPNDKLT